ncbi:MAG: IclR family transcriptional regulator [Ramlibacter sp.]|nr:IclR family transcriptional regulator [Ramlibacter sp.]
MGYTVDSVDEALGLLMVVARHPGLGVTELSKKSGITKPRAFRLLSTLEERGFVQRQQGTANYQLGSASLVLGLTALDQVSLVRQGSKYLDSLVQRFNENVQLRVLDGKESLCVARRDSSHALRIHLPIGSKRPLHAGASGKVLLAFADESFQEKILSMPLSGYTRSTVTSAARLAEELARVRAEGVATSAGEFADGVVSVAVPVWDGSGKVVAALGMSVPVARAPDGGERFVPELRKAADDLSRDLGHRAESQVRR